MATDTKKLDGGPRFQPAEFTIQRFAAKVPSGTTIDDVLGAEFFGNHLDRMKPGMEIVVLSDDFKLDARLRVLTVGKTTASVRVLEDCSNAPETASVKAKDRRETKEPEKLKIEDVKVSHGGPHHNWRFAHGDKVIEHGFGSKADAEAAAEEYVKKANG
ncbi:hypothetical protein [Agrobacterium pusense]|uniref:hypothetical protein n=1 Tax=Agrobacterium pusense TaxID=648995 RepID=UPI000D1A104C|nr:hypothetical protein [Agrobacterium pusense]